MDNSAARESTNRLTTLDHANSRFHDLVLCSYQTQQACLGDDRNILFHITERRDTRFVVLAQTASRRRWRPAVRGVLGDPCEVFLSQPNGRLAQANIVSRHQLGVDDQRMRDENAVLAEFLA